MDTRINLDELLDDILYNFRYEDISITLGDSFIGCEMMRYDEYGNSIERLIIKSVHVEIDNKQYMSDYTQHKIYRYELEIYDDETQDECYARLVKEINNHRKLLPFI